MSATSQRDLTFLAAPTDWARALNLARQVSHGWFRCQALARVARSAPDDRISAIIAEAWESAQTEAEDYKKAAALAWPLRALIEKGSRARSDAFAAPSVGMSERIANPVSRSDALFLIWQAVFPCAGSESALGALLLSCRGHWKAEYLLRQIVEIVASQDEEKARQIIASMPAGKYRRQAEKRLALGQTNSPERSSIRRLPPEAAPRRAAPFVRVGS